MIYSLIGDPLLNDMENVEPMFKLTERGKIMSQVSCIISEEIKEKKSESQ